MTTYLDDEGTLLLPHTGETLIKMNAQYPNFSHPALDTVCDPPCAP
jgi:hypothetical protein